MSGIRRMGVLCAAAVLVCAASAAGANPSEQKRVILAQTTAQTICPEVEMPVCGTKGGKRVTYGNECKAKRDGATDITPGACPVTR
jgi:hypothetical protein